MGSLKKTDSVRRKDVMLSDPFWSDYEKRIREVSIPYQWRKLNDQETLGVPSHAIRNFKIAAGLEKGDFYGFVFQDSDVYKWLEGVSYSLENRRDEKLEETADRVIDLIGRAQQPDGYLDTYFIIKAPEKRWTNLHDCHELYCAGHLIEAAVAYQEATRKTKLLDIACRLADHIDSVFGSDPQKKHGYPGHEEIELALVRLYRATQNERYLKLSAYFLNQRGAQPYYFDEEWEKRGKTGFWNGGGPEQAPSSGKLYNQSHLPVREQDKAVGHAVRAVYLYTAMAGVAAETGDESLLASCRRLWNDIAGRQMYITGGIGSTHSGEAFTFDYDLPNDTVYAETCASIGLVFFSEQMLQMESDAKYADVIEKSLYNILPASVALDGMHFFYVNPLEVWPEASAKNPDKAHVKPVRQPWFSCACCPPNLMRLVESLRSYLYRVSPEGVYVDQYIGSSMHFMRGGASCVLKQKSAYPWKGAISFLLTLDRPAEFQLALRLPGWCEKASLRINDEAVDYGALLNHGYILLRRAWHDGDRVELNLDMPVNLMAANPQVRADAGKAAIQRGPVVYCLEEADNGKNLSALSLKRDTSFRFVPKVLPDAIPEIEFEGFRTCEDGWSDDALYRPYAPQEERVKLRAIPYFAWGNRGEGEMAVWLRVKD